MNRVMMLLCLWALSGCGAETATTAATGAAVKKREIAEGQKTQDEARRKIERSMEQTQQRAEKDSER
jgi:hypothetical protein